MCRILVSSFSINYYELFREVLYYFKSSSENDVVLKKISSISKHRDGWGLVAVGSADNYPAVLFHKTVLPIDHDLSRQVVELFLERLKMYDNVKILVHTRLSSRREPYGEKYTHPFEVIGNKLTIWFIHNGGVDKKSLGKEIGVYPYLYTDSWIAAMYVSKYLDKCVVNENDLDNCVTNTYRKLVEYTIDGSALNTGLLVLYGDKPYLYASFYVKKYDEMSIDRREYYNMYSYVEGEFTAVASSTIKYYSSRDFKPIKQGLFLIENSGLREIDNYE